MSGFGVSGYAQCRLCYRAVKKSWADKNRDKTRAAVARWDKANKARKLEHAKAYQKRYPAKVNEYVVRRYAARRNATPLWANKQYVADMYMLARLVSEITGEKYHVDHIVPLKSDEVCGLHVEHNLQVIHHSANHAKFNTQWPDKP